MINKKNLAALAILIVACILTAVLVLQIERHNNKKIAVVDAIKVFNAFKMKKELEDQSSGRLQYLGHVADSIKTEITVRSKDKNVDTNAIKRIIDAYRQSESDFSQAYQETNQSINEQVWKRLNPLIDEYGKKKGLRLIIGANGMGAVLYNDDYYDNTQALIDFVNERYEKGY